MYPRQHDEVDAVLSEEGELALLLRGLRLLGDGHVVVRDAEPLDDALEVGMVRDDERDLRRDLTRALPPDEVEEAVIVLLRRGVAKRLGASVDRSFHAISYSAASGTMPAETASSPSSRGSNADAHEEARARALSSAAPPRARSRPAPRASR